jgi:hypothetical protein
VQISAWRWRATARHAAPMPKKRNKRAYTCACKNQGRAKDSFQSDTAHAYSAVTHPTPYESYSGNPQPTGGNVRRWPATASPLTRATNSRVTRPSGICSGGYSTASASTMPRTYPAPWLRLPSGWRMKDAGRGERGFRFRVRSPRGRGPVADAHGARPAQHGAAVVLAVWTMIPVGLESLHGALRRALSFVSPID